MQQTGHLACGNDNKHICINVAHFVQLVIFSQLYIPTCVLVPSSLVIRVAAILTHLLSEVSYLTCE